MKSITIIFRVKAVIFGKVLHVNNPSPSKKKKKKKKKKKTTPDKFIPQHVLYVCTHLSSDMNRYVAKNGGKKEQFLSLNYSAQT